MTHYEYPITNVNVENEHFYISDSIISWMENCKASRDDDPKESITNLLPPPATIQDQSSASSIAWNLVKIFGKTQGLSKELVELASTVTSTSIRIQLYYLKIYITTCPQADKLSHEYTIFTQQHLLQDDAHLHSLNNLIEDQNGKLYEYLNDLVSRSIAHIAQCDRCRAKGHYCQLCGPSSLVSSMILSTYDGGGGGANQQQQQTFNTSCDSTKVNHNLHSNSVGSTMAGNTNNNSPSSRQQSKINHSRSSSGSYTNFSPTLQQAGSTGVNNATKPIDDHELIFPFEIGRVAQCRACGCCFHLRCFLEAGQNCPKCERIQRRKAEDPSMSTSSVDDSICTGVEALDLILRQ